MTADRDTCLDPGHMIDVVVGTDMATCLESPLMAKSGLSDHVAGMSA